MWLFQGQSNVKLLKIVVIQANTKKNSGRTLTTHAERRADRRI